MPDNESAPPGILVSPTPTPDQIEQGIRSVVLVLSAGGAILGFVRGHDLSGLIGYLQSGAIVPAVLAVIAAATWARGQWKTRHRAKQLITVASSPKVPDDVAAINTGLPPHTDAADLAGKLNDRLKGTTNG